MMTVVPLHFCLPSVTAWQVHRAGRTARAGRSGLAVSLVTQYDVDIVKNIEVRRSTELMPRDEIEVLSGVHGKNNDRIQA